MRNLILILTTIAFLGCQIPKTKTNPVQINGFGFLTDISKRKIENKELVEIVKTLARNESVNDEDAEATLEIYKNRIDYFIERSGVAETSDEAGNTSIRKYLSLMLQHENLRAKVSDITSQSVYRQAVETFEGKIEDGQVNTVPAGNLVANYLTAFHQTVAKDNREIFNKEIGRQLNAGRINILRAYEQISVEIKENKRRASTESQTNAKLFLDNLKIYDEQLPNEEKILTANGRLISIDGTSETIKNRLLQLMSGGAADSGLKNKSAARQAANNVYKQISLTILDLSVTVKDYNPY